MKTKLEFIGTIDGLRCWKAWSSTYGMYAIVVELLSKFWFHPKLDEFRYEDGNIDAWRAFNRPNDTKRAIAFFQRDGFDPKMLIAKLHAVAPHVFPTFPEKCRNCWCLAIRNDGFVGCISDKHVRWDLDYSPSNEHFALCSTVVDTNRCDPSAIKEYDIVMPRIYQERRRASEKKLAEEKTREDALANATKNLRDLRLKIPYIDDIVNRIDLEYFSISTHNDGAHISANIDTDGKIVIGFDCGWLRAGVSMEQTIENVTKAFAKLNIKVIPDPRAWYSWLYGFGTGNHEYVHFIVERF